MHGCWMSVETGGQYAGRTPRICPAALFFSDSIFPFIQFLSIRSTNLIEDLPVHQLSVC